MTTTSEVAGTERAWTSVVDRLCVGVWIVDESGTLLRSNPVAQCLLRCEDGVYLDAADRVRLADGRTLFDALAGRTAMEVLRPSGRFSYQLTCEPLPGGGALCFVSDPDREFECVGPLLRGIYDLTPAEADVTVRLASGLDLRQVAELRDVSVSTVRTLVKRVFDKVGTRRQIDLVRLVLSGAATACAPTAGHHR